MTKASKTVRGFGFDSSESEHYFFVSIPSSPQGDIQISEHLSWDPSRWEGKTRAVQKDTDERLRVILPRVKWEAIKTAITTAFNSRLGREMLPKGRWKNNGLTPVSRLFGKELVLLAWAIEDADPGQIPAALKNWLGLTPEERWWLFTMTNAATGQALRGRNTGWRKAVRFALTENPVSSAVRPEQRAGIISGLHSELRDSSDRQKQGTLQDFSDA